MEPWKLISWPDGRQKPENGHLRLSNKNLKCQQKQIHWKDQGISLKKIQLFQN